MDRPLTTAELRAEEVRRTRTTTPRTREPRPPAPSSAEEWIDEGPIREAAADAAQRAASGATGGGAAGDHVAEAPRRQRAPGVLDPEVVAVVEREAGSQRAGRYRERLTSAAEALGRGRFDDARRMVTPVLRDLPGVAMGHEIAGLSWYGVGQWRRALGELEQARELDHGVRLHAVLADCYRALRRYDKVDELWAELKSASPDPALMAEGRIVAAGARADRGDLSGALQVMEPAKPAPKKVREHHLRQWYVIADLLDRSGDVVQARRFFELVATHDAAFADVERRLAGLGR